MIAGFLFATELEFLKEKLPEAKFVNAVDLLDEVTFVKDPEEIRLMRQASAIADAAQARVMEHLEVGLTEMEIAGIGEMEMRRRGSEFHWPVTGSSEIASGYRSWYAMGGCTPPTDKVLQPGESLLVDMHPTYKQYYSDLSHNYIIGQPSPEQRKLADAYLEAAEVLIANLKTGRTVGQVAKTVAAVVEKSGYAAYTLPGYGHGLGVIGHEWYPAILDNDEFRDVVPFGKRGRSSRISDKCPGSGRNAPGMPGEGDRLGRGNALHHPPGTDRSGLMTVFRAAGFNRDNRRPAVPGMNRDASKK